MEFEYYTDEIVLNNEMINNEVEVAPLDSFILSAKNYLKEMGINPQSTTFFYKRNNKRSTILFASSSGLSLLPFINQK